MTAIVACREGSLQFLNVMKLMTEFNNGLRLS